MKTFKDSYKNDEWATIGPTKDECHTRGELAPQDVYSIINHSEYKGIKGYFKLIGLMRRANKKQKEAMRRIHGNMPKAER